jgi:hypothetical protein
MARVQIRVKQFRYDQLAAEPAAYIPIPGEGTRTEKRDPEPSAAANLLAKSQNRVYFLPCLGRVFFSPPLEAPARIAAKSLEICEHAGSTEKSLKQFILIHLAPNMSSSLLTAYDFLRASTALTCRSEFLP